jgi:hypothetical protein
MKNHWRLIFGSIILFLIYIVCVYWNFDKVLAYKGVHKQILSRWRQKNIEINISVVACGIHRVEEVIVLIKSALIFSLKTHKLKFWIVTERELFQTFLEKIEEFHQYHDFSFVLKETKFPKDQGDVWRKLFKPCASQRLFLASLLPEVDELIYVGKLGWSCLVCIGVDCIFNFRFRHSFPLSTEPSSRILSKVQLHSNRWFGARVGKQEHWMVSKIRPT